MFIVCVRGMFQYEMDLDYIVLRWGRQKAEPCSSRIVKFVGVQGSGGALAQMCDTETVLLQL